MSNYNNMTDGQAAAHDRMLEEQREWFRQDEARRSEEQWRANRQRIVDAGNALSQRHPVTSDTDQDGMAWRLRMANLVGALQGLAASGDLNDEGVKCVCEVLGRVG